MKKFAAFSLTLLMAISLVACAGNNESAETGSLDAAGSVSEETSVPESSVAESEPESETAQPGETEETEPVPETDTEAEEPYTDADLNYNDDNSRSTLEMNDSSARPTISGSVENMEQYDIVFIGYPKMEYGFNCISCI